ncbi:hypothetical protein [Natrononativus amylolyticus]|nr:hypothetical protein [Natrononativus amylolyticus]
MSQSKQPTAVDAYKQHPDEIEELAERDDEIGAACRAVLRVVGELDE